LILNRRDLNYLASWRRRRRIRYVDHAGTLERRAISDPGTNLRLRSFMVWMRPSRISAYKVKRLIPKNRNASSTVYRRRGSKGPSGSGAGAGACEVFI
jgi:hypothetical protein